MPRSKASVYGDQIKSIKNPLYKYSSNDKLLNIKIDEIKNIIVFYGNVDRDSIKLERTWSADEFNNPIIIEIKLSFINNENKEEAFCYCYTDIAVNYNNFERSKHLIRNIMRKVREKYIDVDFEDDLIHN